MVHQAFPDLHAEVMFSFLVQLGVMPGPGTPA